MIAFLRRLAASLVAASALCASAATTTSIDYTDVWYTAAENGHGMYIVQNGNTMFVTLFVYGGDTLPRWYFASSVTPVGSSTTTFSGQLFRSQGTSFAAPWSPSQFNTFAVGTINLSFTSPTQGTVSYSVDNVSVAPQPVTRLALAPVNYAGTYFGGLTANTTQCTQANPGGYLFANRLTVDNSSANPRFTVDYVTVAGPATCVFTGTYVQAGTMGAVSNGTFQCSGAINNAGTFTMTELQATRNGISARFSGRDQHCGVIDGFFGGVRDVL
jgi:hypothetical protein